MSGSLSIPNTFATASGTVSLSLLDADFSAISGYVNTREISIGTAAARPAAAVAGRWYFASDTGLLYVDTGSAWTQVGNTGIAAAAGAPRVQGLAAVNNAGTPTTKLDLTADFLQLRNPSTGGVLIVASPGTITNDVTVATAANGRDQAGAFTASTFVHFYFISDGVTTATLASATPPPTGPTLPGAYTHWAYATSWRFDGSSALVSCIGRGAWVNYASQVTVVVDGKAGSVTAVGLSSAVLATATRAELALSSTVASASSPFNNPQIQVVSGQTFWSSRANNAGALNGHTQSLVLTVPNVGQQVFYSWAAAPSTGNGLYLSVVGYACPNGDV